MKMSKLKKFVINNILKDPIVRKYSLWVFLLGSIAMMIELGFKALLIIIPLSFILCFWIFWASDSFQEMKDGGQRIRWMIDARKKEKLKQKEALKNG